MEGTFFRTSGNTYTNTTMHYRLATSVRLIKFLERGIGGGGKTWPASPVHFECSTPQPLSCRRSSPITCRDCGALTVEILKSNQELSQWLRAPTWPHGDDFRDRINQPGLAPALHTLAGSHPQQKGLRPLADRSLLSISSCRFTACPNVNRPIRSSSVSNRTDRCHCEILGWRLLGGDLSPQKSLHCNTMR
jgi:hypothetical protein